jgi:hypothetical protein
MAEQRAICLVQVVVFATESRHSRNAFPVSLVISENYPALDALLRSFLTLISIPTDFSGVDEAEALVFADVVETANRILIEERKGVTLDATNVNHMPDSGLASMSSGNFQHLISPTHSNNSFQNADRIQFPANEYHSAQPVNLMSSVSQTPTSVNKPNEIPTQLSFQLAVPTNTTPSGPTTSNAITSSTSSVALNVPPLQPLGNWEHESQQIKAQKAQQHAQQQKYPEPASAALPQPPKPEWVAQPLLEYSNYRGKRVKDSHKVWVRNTAQSSATFAPSAAPPSATELLNELKQRPDCQEIVQELLAFNGDPVQTLGFLCNMDESVKAWVDARIGKSICDNIHNGDADISSDDSSRIRVHQHVRHDYNKDYTIKKSDTHQSLPLRWGAQKDSASNSSEDEAPRSQSSDLHTRGRQQHEQSSRSQQQRQQPLQHKKKGPSNDDILRLQQLCEANGVTPMYKSVIVGSVNTREGQELKTYSCQVKISDRIFASVTAHSREDAMFSGATKAIQQYELYLKKMEEDAELNKQLQESFKRLRLPQAD